MTEWRAIELIPMNARQNARFWEKVKKQDIGECWLWTSFINKTGYGVFSLNGSAVRAHRLSVIMDGRTIPNGMEIDHLCRVRNCVNPSHLEVVSSEENRRRGEPYRMASVMAFHLGKTHCKRGHPFSEGDYSVTKHGHKRCLPCERMHDAKRRKGIAL